MSVYVENKIHNNLCESLTDFNANSKHNSRFTFTQVIQKVEYWIERSKQRRALAALDNHILNDIGYSRTEAQREASKPFWK